MVPLPAVFAVRFDVIFVINCVFFVRLCCRCWCRVLKTKISPGSRQMTKKRTNSCLIIRVLDAELNGDAEELSFGVFSAFFRGGIVSERCRFGAGFREVRGGRAAAAFQISRAPQLPAFRPGVVVHGVPLLDLR